VNFIVELAQDAGVTGSYFTRVLRLTFLAPEILKVILSDGHPIDLSAKRLANDTRLPVAWDAQHALLGLG
jgi:site-specific DNA recombinase